MKAMHHKRIQEVLKKDRSTEPIIRLPSEGGHVLVCSGAQHWCALCGVKGPLRRVGQQKCSGAKRERWQQKAAVNSLLSTDCQSRGHLRMISGQVVWCDRCGAYGTHRGCGLAHPCPGPAVMGSGGGKWQRLRLLRAGRHPKDKIWIGPPVPETAWSSATVSAVNTALQEVRSGKTVDDHEAPAPPLPPSSSTSRFELLRQRVVQRELASTNRVSTTVGDADSSSRPVSTGMQAPVESRFEALRRRVKTKEMVAKGELLLDE